MVTSKTRKVRGLKQDVDSAGATRLELVTSKTRKVRGLKPVKVSTVLIGLPCVTSKTRKVRGLKRGQGSGGTKGRGSYIEDPKS